MRPFLGLSHLNKMNGDNTGQARKEGRMEGGLDKVEQERSNKARLVGYCGSYWRCTLPAAENVSPTNRISVSVVFTDMSEFVCVC